MDEALRQVEEFSEASRGGSLDILEEMLDGGGEALAAINDRALAKGWEPAGFEQEDGFRTLYYRPGTQNLTSELKI